ncbi:MAG: Tetratricopeptide 2 repeat protein [Deltaproteobacteria bacterium]|nr:Tetratricopeptide 2 repeat protein [Deltaproteobacteria bacterium]
MDQMTAKLRVVTRCALAAALAVGSALGCATAPSPETKSVAASPPSSRNASQRDRLDGSAELSQPQRRARVHYQTAIDHLRQDRPPEAVGELLSAERFDPMDEEIQFALAEAYRRQGRDAETEAHLLRALQIRPNYHEARLNLAAFYISVERIEEAVPLLNQMLADPTFPSPWRALTNLGWAEYRLGRLDEAHQHLSLAVDYRPDYWPARLNLGILEGERGNRAEAIQHFERVLEGKPSPLAEAEVRYRLAEQLLALGDKKGAVRHLTVASDLRPNGPWSKRSAEYLKTLH